MDSRKRSLSTDTRRRNSSPVVVQEGAHSHTGMEPTVHLLSYELYVASIPRDELSSATHSLLQILLRLFQDNSDCRRKHFFSFTGTATEFSVILDAELLKILKPASSSSKIDVTECKWRALVVEVGAMGSLTGISSIVASVIAPLANCGVSVFCLSTNLDDFVLVKEGDLEKALTCLSKSFRLMCDSERKLDLALVQSMKQRSTGMDTPKRKHSSCPSSEAGSRRPITHPYSCFSTQYCICGIIPRALPSIGSALLQLMLFNHRSSSEETFLSFSIVEDDISIVMDCRDIARLPEESLYINKETWRMIRLEGPLGFDECGIVAQVSTPLAQADISTYYICTFNTDHTLIREENVEKTLRLLNERYVLRMIKKMCTNGGVLSPLAGPTLRSSSSSLYSTSYTTTTLQEVKTYTAPVLQEAT